VVCGEAQHELNPLLTSARGRSPGCLPFITVDELWCHKTGGERVVKILRLCELSDAQLVDGAPAARAAMCFASFR
jgi:hypothetical protein